MFLSNVAVQYWRVYRVGNVSRVMMRWSKQWGSPCRRWRFVSSCKSVTFCFITFQRFRIAYTHSSVWHVIYPILHRQSTSPSSIMKVHAFYCWWFTVGDWGQLGCGNSSGDVRRLSTAAEKHKEGCGYIVWRQRGFRQSTVVKVNTNQLPGTL